MGYFQNLMVHRIFPVTLALSGYIRIPYVCTTHTSANFAVLPPQLTTVFIVGMVMIIRITIIIMIILTIYIKQPQKLHLFLNLFGGKQKLDHHFKPVKPYHPLCLTIM
jgi:hypothetical protein